MQSHTPRRLVIGEPALPDLAEIQEDLATIWGRRWLTNAGPFHEELEGRLRDDLGAADLTLCANGTSAISLAMQALDVTGDVLTTPFTFPATVHALQLAGLNPVFCDVEPGTLTIDPAEVERRITPATTAILGVHLYGGACDVDALAEIAARRGLRLVYDGAHAFGVHVHGRPIGAYGDATTFSFHATKIFHTLEGGAIALADPAAGRRIRALRNHGYGEDGDVVEPGMNSKLNELGAAVGLRLFARFGDEIAGRTRVAAGLRARLDEIPGVNPLVERAGVVSNHSYFPVLVDAGAADLDADALLAALAAGDVVARRYFSPLCTELPSTRELPSADPRGLPNAVAAEQAVLCLPINGRMSDADVERMGDLVERAVRDAKGGARLRVPSAVPTPPAVPGVARPARPRRFARPVAVAAAVAGILVAFVLAVGWSSSAPQSPDLATLRYADGRVAHVDEERIVLRPFEPIEGEDGHVEFAIHPDDADRFDPDHLRVLIDEAMPLRIHFETVDGRRFARFKQHAPISD